MNESRREVSYSLSRVLRLLKRLYVSYYALLLLHVLGPKEEKGPSEPDEQVVLQPVLHHGEPGALLVVGEERRNRGIPRELLGLLNQGTYAPFGHH